MAAGGGDYGGRLGRPRGGGVEDTVGATAGARCGSGGGDGSAGREARAPAPVAARLEREIERREWVGTGGRGVWMERSRVRGGAFCRNAPPSRSLCVAHFCGMRHK